MWDGSKHPTNVASHDTRDVLTFIDVSEIAADIRGMLAVSGDSIDHAFLGRAVGELGLETQWRAVEGS